MWRRFWLPRTETFCDFDNVPIIGFWRFWLPHLGKEIWGCDDVSMFGYFCGVRGGSGSHHQRCALLYEILPTFRYYFKPLTIWRTSGWDICYPQFFQDHVSISTHKGGAWLTSSVEQKRSRSTTPVCIQRNFSLIILSRTVSEGVATNNNTKAQVRKQYNDKCWHKLPTGIGFIHSSLGILTQFHISASPPISRMVDPYSHLPVFSNLAFIVASSPLYHSVSKNQLCTKLSSSAPS